MSRALSANAKEEVFAQNTGEVFITLITISHDALSEDIRIADDSKEMLSTGVRGVISGGLEYVHLPFELVPPGESGDSSPMGRLKIDNISREVIHAVRQITSPADIAIQIITGSDPDVVEANITGFQLSNIRSDALIVEGQLTLCRFDLEPFPSSTFTPSKFPGIN